MCHGKLWFPLSLISPGYYPVGPDFFPGFTVCWKLPRPCNSPKRGRTKRKKAENNPQSSPWNVTPLISMLTCGASEGKFKLTMCVGIKCDHVMAHKWERRESWFLVKENPMTVDAVSDSQLGLRQLQLSWSLSFIIPTGFTSLRFSLPSKLVPMPALAVYT